ncbi:MAG TPA: acetylornithine deacetylase [Steroidobacteraceae bacterium]|nr:acetylornithine deacetylase [Steroidobacteraceae bacterium]
MNSMQILERLVGFPTVSRDSNLDLIGFVRGYLASHGIESRLYTDPTGLKANLYASVGRPGAGGVLLSGHSDVVPVDGQKWSSDPFQLREQAGRLYARGAADMKGFLACAIAALARASQRSLRLPLQLAVSYDEEVGCVGVRSLIDDMEGWTDLPRVCIVGEPTLLRIAVGHKGKTALRATCRGLAAHSARPDRGQNAIHLGADLVQMIRARQAGIEASGPRDPGYEVPYTTLHVGAIHGGTALNIVPDHCGLELEIRNISADDSALHIHGLREDARRIALEATQRGPAADIHIEVINEYPGLDTPQDSDIVDLVAGLTGNRECIKVGFGSEGGLFSQRLKIPTVVCGPGSIEQAHKPDEYLSSEQLSRCDSMMDALLEHLA